MARPKKGKVGKNEWDFCWTCIFHAVVLHAFHGHFVMCFPTIVLINCCQSLVAFWFSDVAVLTRCLQVLKGGLWMCVESSEVSHVFIFPFAGV